jgi:hypothetical protein
MTDNVVQEMDVARQDLPEAKFDEANSRSGHENEGTELVTIGASMPRYELLKHISRKKRVPRKILKQVLKLYDLEHADQELEVVDQVERLLGLEAFPWASPLERMNTIAVVVDRSLEKVLIRLGWVYNFHSLLSVCCGNKLIICFINPGIANFRSLWWRLME